ncbi:MAG: adenosine deaminase [Clostridia bacterium]|nr:adenosine deaminase [Clostridia bacterium]
MDNIIEDMPLVDLHLHIDGALGLSKAYEIIKRDNIDVGKEINSIEDLKDLLIVPDDVDSLDGFLERFVVPVKLLQTKEHIEELVEDLVVRLANEKVIYAELRFAPQLHTNEGMLMEEVVEAALNGMNNGMKKCDNIKCKLILCMMRGASMDKNRDTITVASKYLDKGVAGIDLAGAEGLYPTKDYEEFFEYAKERHVPFTIHAGEASGPDSVKCAIDFGTSRIGHGIAIKDDKEVYDEVKHKSILLEVCPTSNVKTNTVSSLEEHPIKQFFDDGLNVCINTDDMTLQGSTLREEYYNLKNIFNFSYQDMIKLNINAIKSSFMNEEDKPKYIKLLETYLN